MQTRSGRSHKPPLNRDQAILPLTMRQKVPQPNDMLAIPGSITAADADQPDPLMSGHLQSGRSLYPVLKWS